METNQGGVLSGFHEAVRDFCREARLIFSADGVKLVGQDSAKVVLVQYLLPVSRIDIPGQGKYRCQGGNIEVGIDTKIVASCLSTVAWGDIVGISIDLDDDPDRLVIRSQNPVAGKRSLFKVIVPELAEDCLTCKQIESCGYNGEIVMNSTLFHDMVRDLKKSEATSVRVCCDGKTLSMVANGRHIKSSFNVLCGTGPGHFQYTPRQQDRWPVCECFSMGFVEKVSKAKAVADNISIFLQQNFPVAFTYNSPLGALSFIISAVEDEEWSRNPETRVMPSPVDDITDIEPRSKLAVSAAAPAGLDGKRRRRRGGVSPDAPKQKLSKKDENIEEGEIVSDSE